MIPNKRNFILFSKHKRLIRLWQCLFTGWGLLLICIIIATSLVTKQILWTPISAINMSEITNNQFQINNLDFAGIDSDGNPFKLQAKKCRQEYKNIDIIVFEHVSGTITKQQNGKKTVNDISAKIGIYNRTTKTITLKGNVVLISNTGDKIFTNELVIKL